MVLRQRLPHQLLEVQRALFHLGVHLAVDKDTRVDVPLGIGAEHLVLGHDALVHVVNELEVLVARVLVPVHFVLHHRLSGAERHEPLHEEEVWPAAGTSA